MRRPWIKIETATPDKPEICAIATQLRMDADMVVGKLIRLWSWITVNKISGSDLGVTKEFLDKLVGRKGFADALQSAGWLIETRGKLSMPHFERHNSDAAKVRALTAQRVKRHRIVKEIEAQDSVSVVTSTQELGTPSQVEVENLAMAESVEIKPEEGLAEASLPMEEEVMLQPEEGMRTNPGAAEQAPEVGTEQASEALSINAERTFRPLDFENPPLHESDEEVVVASPVVPESKAEMAQVEAGPLLVEPAPAKKSKRKADEKENDQPLLF